MTDSINDDDSSGTPFLLVVLVVAVLFVFSVFVYTFSHGIQKNENSFGEEPSEILLKNAVFREECVMEINMDGQILGLSKCFITDEGGHIYSASYDKQYKELRLVNAAHGRVYGLLDSNTKIKKIIYPHDENWQEYLERFARWQFAPDEIQ